MPQNPRAVWYRYLNQPSFDSRASLVVNVFLAMVILLNIIEVVLFSVTSIAMQLGTWSRVANYGFAAIFALEYGMRIWVAAETPSEIKRSNWQKRWQYIKSPMGLIDLFSFLPILLWLVFPVGFFNDFRALKLISMVRVFKLTRYSTSLAILARVYQENRNILLAAILVMLILSFMAATGIYLFERKVQPETFGSIPASMWWAFVTLTTVGYGDMTPITLGGKLFGAIIMVCGVGVAAIPAGIFASSFVQLIKEQEKARRRYRRQQLLEKRKTELDDEGGDSQTETLLHLELSRSEQREVDYLMQEFKLTLDQSVGVVMHFRH